MSRLTAAQQRILAEVRADGERVYNGRARRTIEAHAAMSVPVEPSANALVASEYEDARP